MDPTHASPDTSEAESLRAAIRAAGREGEAPALAELISIAGLDPTARTRIATRGAAFVQTVRDEAETGLMELFLAEYGLSTREGIALMCLAEALLRTPDADTVDALIEDKIAPSDWSAHLGQAASPLVNASTWALMLTGRVLSDDDTWLVGAVRGAVKRLGEPVIRTAVSGAIRELGRQFVLGRDIDEALKRAETAESEGYLHSYDMLGEAARTAADADRYLGAYTSAMTAIATRADSDDARRNPGISVKLSALHPRYEEAQRDRVLAELGPRLFDLAKAARSARIGLTIDAEEAERLDLSLDLIEATGGSSELAGWDGFGMVVQAYSPQAPRVIDWLYDLAGRAGRRFMVRLVKGAYWDAEIKRAQILGLERFPVFTRKPSSDVSYIACARKLLDMRDRLWPQFATHNAHTAAAVLDLAGDASEIEFQRLHGMGAAFHDLLRQSPGTPVRIYAPVGAHRDLLAYLVRRMLENGANSSFVHKMVDKRLSAQEIAADPFEAVGAYIKAPAHPAIRTGRGLFEPGRMNSRGFDLADRGDLAEIDAARDPFRAHRWSAAPMLAATTAIEPGRTVTSPSDAGDVVGRLTDATANHVAAAVDAAAAGQPAWEAKGAAARATILRQASDLYEAHFGELYALLAREAGKTPPDAIGEVREAVDFLRYYAGRVEAEGDGGRACGVFVCISPWNFPLAIFTGQIAAALATGNAVIAKPAEQTPLIAARAVELLREAGVPTDILQLLPGDGPTIGGALVAEPRIAGVVFTGSTATAQAINRGMARSAPTDAPLIAETGGLNAMIVDSTALPEQAVRDIIASAFQSAGQRCSALRVLYIQDSVADPVSEMLLGAMDELRLGDPWALATDIGPVIDAEALADIEAYVGQAEAEGRLMKQLAAPDGGLFRGPAIVKVGGIGDLDREVFGPVLHIATFAADELAEVLDDINASGFGLTFGLHTRIDDRVAMAVDRLCVGNVYVNRNQIGAVVGSQPFGGEGLSGTGPKAGGPHYLGRFRKHPVRQASAPALSGRPLSLAELRAALTGLPAGDPMARDMETLPGPTGESNLLRTFARRRVLCLGPGAGAAAEQAARARAVGCAALAVAPGIEKGLDGTVGADVLVDLDGVDVVIFQGDEDTSRAFRRALADRDGPIIPLVMDADIESWLSLERSLCIDTTAAGGNASLLSQSE